MRTNDRFADPDRYFEDAEREACRAVDGVRFTDEEIHTISVELRDLYIDAEDADGLAELVDLFIETVLERRPGFPFCNELAAWERLRDGDVRQAERYARFGIEERDAAERNALRVLWN